MIEFQLGWCRRNLPRDRAEYSFVVCDSGQFMFDDNRMTGLLDFELAYIGDYAADLASFRTRDLTEPMVIPLGDIMRRYGEISGREIDVNAVVSSFFYSLKNLSAFQKCLCRYTTPI